MGFNSAFKGLNYAREDTGKSFKQMSYATYSVYAYDVSVMTEKSTKFSHKAVKFKRHNKECNVVVSKECKYMRMTAYRRKVNTTRNTYTLLHDASKFQEHRKG